MSSGLMLLTVTATAAMTSTTSPSTRVPPPTGTSTIAVVERPVVRPENARGYAVEPGVTYADVLLLLPRILLAPPRWILTAVFWPLQWSMEFIEETKLIEHTIDLLYNDERTAGIFPVVNVLSSQGVSAGATAFHDDLFGSEEHLALGASFGGIVDQSYRLSFAADRMFDKPLWIESEVRWERNPRLYFAGIGDHEDNPTPSRFAQDRFLGRLRLGTTHGRPDSRVKTGVSIIYNRRRYEGARRLGSGEQSIEDVYDTSDIPGFDAGTSLFEVTADLVLDFRNHKGQTSRGFYFEGFGGGVPTQDGYGYFHWGAELTGFIELFNETRVLVLHGAIEGVEGAKDKIPLSDLARLGGPARLRGYQVEGFRDEKALMVSATYHYPIHQYLTGVLFVDAGRVGERYGDLFDAKTWHVGGGGGLRVGSKSSTIFEIDIAYGDGLFFSLSTDPFRAFANRTQQL